MRVAAAVASDTRNQRLLAGIARTSVREMLQLAEPEALSRHPKGTGDAVAICPQ